MHKGGKGYSVVFLGICKGCIFGKKWYVEGEGFGRRKKCHWIPAKCYFGLKCNLPEVTGIS